MTTDESPFTSSTLSMLRLKYIILGTVRANTRQKAWLQRNSSVPTTYTHGMSVYTVHCRPKPIKNRNWRTSNCFQLSNVWSSFHEKKHAQFLLETSTTALKSGFRCLIQLSRKGAVSVWHQCNSFEIRFEICFENQQSIAIFNIEVIIKTESSGLI